jgi:hypothetical protein
MVCHSWNADGRSTLPRYRATELFGDPGAVAQLVKDCDVGQSLVHRTMRPYLLGPLAEMAKVTPTFRTWRSCR